jgi:uncharacterized RDD family membrane protein YckC
MFGRHFSARPEGSPYPKAELLPRLLARLTDFLLAVLFPLVLGEPGGILAALYLLFADGVFHGQSVGKRLLGIKVMILSPRSEADYRRSALRNFPFAVVALLGLLPGGRGLLMGCAAAVVLAVEGTMALADKLGLRLGDLVSGTQVVDTKVLAIKKVRPVLEPVRAEGAHAQPAASVRLDPIVSPRQAA